MANMYPQSIISDTRTATRQPPSAASQGDCISKVRVPEIHEAAAELQSSVERLHAQIAVLEDRLSSVLMPIPRSDVNAVRREMSSPIGQAITARVTEVDQAVTRIDHLIDALAV